MVRLQEQFGYAYGAAWNLNRRTNNVLVQTFGVNQLNELTTGTRSGTFTVAGTATEPLGSIYGYPYGVTNVTVIELDTPTIAREVPKKINAGKASRVRTK